MSMTKKDYELVASVFNKEITHNRKLQHLSPAFKHGVTTLSGMAVEIADRLQLEDKRFKRNEFLKLCGVKD